MPSIFQALAMAIAVLGTGTATVSVLNTDIPDMAIPAADWQASGSLDGMDFAITATFDQNDAVETDILRFADGRFHSVDCERYCNFGWTGYQTWTDGDVTHFAAVTRCPTAPHTVVWHGQVVGDEIAVEMSWTTRRWYWTHQITGTGTGSLAEDLDGAAAAG